MALLLGLVTRGHGRKNESNSFLLKDHHWSECGDEVIILKNNLQPTFQSMFLETKFLLPNNYLILVVMLFY